MNSKGYSLLEVAMVSAVVGVAGTVVIPNFKGMSRTAQVQADIRRIGDALLKARGQARLSLNCVAVDVQPHVMVVTTYRVCGPPLADPVSTETINFGSEITLTPFDTGNPLTFAQTGGTWATGPSTLTISSTLTREYRYVVMPAIGSVRMQ